MRLVKKIVIIFFLIVIILAGLYGYSLSQVKIENVTANLQEINLSGFKVEGNINLYNGGILPVGINQIDYKIILEESGKELVNGNIKGKIIPPKSSRSFTFSTSIYWIPTSEVAWGLITSHQTYAKIKGTVSVAHLKVINFKIPFEIRIDLEQYIKQFAKKTIEETVDKVTNGITNVVDTVGEGIKNIADKLLG